MPFFIYPLSNTESGFGSANLAAFPVAGLDDDPKSEEDDVLPNPPPPKLFDAGGCSIAPARFSAPRGRSKPKRL